MSVPRYPFVHVLLPREEVDFIGSELWDLGAMGLEERDHTTIDRPNENDLGDERVLLIASFPDFDAAEEALAHLADKSPRLVVLEGDEWRDEWKKYFEPARIAGRLCLQPPWKKWPEAGNDVVLTIDPGRAFGTGLHETTRLVLAQIEATVEGGERVLDVGCGSGILAIAALRLGAKSALCVDNDPEVVPITLENANVNKVGDRLRAASTPIEEVKGEFEHVYANIQAHVLIPMAEALKERVAPGGLLILSGILAEYEQPVRVAFGPWNVETVRRENEWVALALRA